ncbi:MAG: ribosomal small subunit methyltransferase [Pseudomonadota bacterium]|jgi:16S rRNA (guanine527-N7)-methyltransferase
MPLSNILRQGIADLSLTIDDQSQQKMLDYLALLHKWNKTYNLTAIRQPEQMVINHLLDSLAVLPYLWQGKWLDVGCGAGLPGLVLATVKPEWAFTLIDSSSKKTSFVAQAIIELGLKNAQVICGRVEDLPANIKYDGIISRAFSDTQDFIMKTRHLLVAGGGWAAMKGLPEDELMRLPVGISVESIHTLKVPNLLAARSLVVLRESL